MDLIRNDVKKKNGSDIWGTLYGRPMEGLAVHYHRDEEITRYICMSDMHYQPTVMCVLLCFAYL